MSKFGKLLIATVTLVAIGLLLFGAGGHAVGGKDKGAAKDKGAVKDKKDGDKDKKDGDKDKKKEPSPTAPVGAIITGTIESFNADKNSFDLRIKGPAGEGSMRSYMLPESGILVHQGGSEMQVKKGHFRKVVLPGTRVSCFYVGDTAEFIMVYAKVELDLFTGTFMKHDAQKNEITCFGAWNEMKHQVTTFACGHVMRIPIDSFSFGRQVLLVTGTGANAKTVSSITLLPKR